MFETRVLWQKYRNQKSVDKQSKVESELIIVTILKETLKKLPGMYILYHILRYIDVQVYLLQGVIKRTYLIYEIDSSFNGVYLRQGLTHKFVIKSSLHREHLS